MLLQLYHFFLPFIPLYPIHPSIIPHLSSCPQARHISFYISYTLLNLPLFILYLPFMLLILRTFPLSPAHSTTDKPSCDLHFCDSVPVLVVCLVFVFVFFLGSVVDICEFINHFTVHIFDLLFLR